MKIKYAFYGYILANVILLLVLGSISLVAYRQSQSDPEPVFGDRKTFTDSFDYYLTKEYGNYSVALFLYRPPFPLNSYNQTFVKATLKLRVNSSDVIAVSLGELVVYYYYTKDGITRDYSFCTPKLSFQTSFLDTSLSWTEQQLPKFKIYSSTNEEIFDYPCIYWTKGANVTWKYVETWEYTPLTAYDYSLIESAEDLLASYKTYFWTIFISDFLIVCSLLGLSFHKRNDN